MLPAQLTIYTTKYTHIHIQEIVPFFLANFTTWKKLASCPYITCQWEKTCQATLGLILLTYLLRKIILLFFYILVYFILEDLEIFQWHSTMTFGKIDYSWVRNKRAGTFINFQAFFQGARSYFAQYFLFILTFFNKPA